YFRFCVLLYCSSFVTDGMNIRLVNGTGSCSGRVEVYYNGEWGTVCDAYWDMNDTAVVCRQVGCGEALSVNSSGHFGAGSGPIHLDNVACSGSENSITSCNHSSSHNCGHGEDAGVTCAVLTKPLQRKLSVQTQTSQSSATFTLAVDTSDQGQYSCDCSYQRSSSSTSSRSSTVNITVGKSTKHDFIISFNSNNGGSNLRPPAHSGSALDRWTAISFLNGFSTVPKIHLTKVTLPTPRISLNPTEEISWGERVDITCSVETQFREGSFTLTQSSGSLRETKRGTSVTFSFLKVDFVHEGSYFCQYKTRVSSRDFSSPQSSSVKFLVVVNLLQPTISFSDPDGGSHWGPQGLEVTRGYSFSIICSAQPQYRGGSFHLEFSGSNIISINQPAVNHSATFFFHEADYEHQGNYSCVYEVTVSSRTFRSSNTELLAITVKGTLRNTTFIFTFILQFEQKTVAEAKERFQKQNKTKNAKKKSTENSQKHKNKSKDWQNSN
uniref:SRCR domain-containing protein n=1 Tax=Astyanax mexicanus TaxID=7994 RepID=A0A3B1K4Q8_ASTMX